MLIVTDVHKQIEPMVDYKSLEVYEEVNGEFNISFTSLFTEINKYSYPLLQEESIIETEDGHEFRVKGLGEVRNRKTVNARHIFFDLINERIDDIIGGNKTPNDVFLFLLKDTGWTFEVVEDIPQQIFMDFGNDNVLNLIRQASDIFQCEVKIEPKKHLKIYKKIGLDDDFQFRYKKNIKALKRDVNTDDLTTAIRAYGADGLIVEYHSPNEAIYGTLWADDIEDERFTIPEHLIEYAKQHVNDVPEVSIEIEELELESPRKLGDTVWLIYEPMGIEFQTRIMATRTRPQEKGRNSVTIGNIKYSNSDLLTETKVVINENKKQVMSKIEQTNDRINLEVTRVDGLESKIEITEGKIDLVVSDNNQINADAIASSISLTPTAIDMISQNINITGKVTFNSLDSSMQNLIENINNNANNAIEKASSALGTLDEIYHYNPYAGKTVIDGNKIYTDYLSSISANLGSVNIGTLTSEDKSTKFQLTSGNIQLTDATGRYMKVNPTSIYMYNNDGSVRFRADQQLVTSAAFGSVNTNVYLTSTSEARVVDYYSIPGDGDPYSYQYRPIRAYNFIAHGGGIFSSFSAGAVLRSNDGHSVHLQGADVRCTVPKDPSSFVNLYAANIYSNGSQLASQTWVNGRGFVASGDYPYFTGISVGSGYVATNALDIYSATHLYVRPASDGEVRITAKGTTGSYRPIRASDYLPPNSTRESKTDIIEYTENVLDTFRNTNVYTYRYKWEDENTFRRLGVMVDETPRILHGKEGDSIELYAYGSYLFKGIKEIVEELDKQKELNEQLILKNANLEERLSKLEVV